MVERVPTFGRVHTARFAGPPGATGCRRSVIRAAGRGTLVATTFAVAALLVRVITPTTRHPGARRVVAVLPVVSRMLLRTLGIEIRSHGRPAPGPCLVVANQVSWLDVLVLTAAAPMVPVATAEVAARPWIGALAARLGAVMVRPNEHRHAPELVAELTCALRRGHRVQVFPESMAEPGPTGFPGSTTGCGSALRPFRRAAFQAAVDAAVVISPVSLTYQGAALATPQTALTGDDDLLGLLWRVLRGGPVTVRVHWLPAIPAVVGTEHPADSRAIAAWRAERALARALGQPAPDRRLGRSAPLVRPPARTPALQVA